MIVLSIKATIPFGRRTVLLGSISFGGTLFCCPIGRRLLVDAIVAGPLVWEWCRRPDRQKRGGTCHRSCTTPQARYHASLCITPSFEKYSQDENTLCEIQQGLPSDACTFPSPVRGIM